MSEDAGHILIVGAGEGLSASLARLFHAEGFGVSLAARNTQKLAALTDETRAHVIACDSSREVDVAQLFDSLETDPDIVVYNPSSRRRGPLVDIEPEDVRKALDVTACGAFLVAREAVRRMLPRRKGTVLFTGASAGFKGFAQSAPFAMGKFALRGLAQSMARELHPQGIHVAYVNIDGAIRNPGRTEPPDRPKSMLDPDEIAKAYLWLHRQDKSVWSDELSIRPWVESF